MNVISEIANSSRGLKGRFGERALERLLASNGRTILEGPLTTGKGVFEEGADIITYNKATKTIELWDSKYFVNSKSVSRAPTLTKAERLEANIAKTRELIEGSGLPHESEMLAALERQGGIKRYIGKAGSGNNVRGVTRRLEQAGVEFADIEFIRATGESEIAVARQARRLVARRAMKTVAVAGIVLSVAMDASELHAAEVQDELFSKVIGDYRRLEPSFATSSTLMNANVIHAALGVAAEEGGTYIGAVGGGGLAGFLGLPAGPGAVATGAAGALGGGWLGGKTGRWIGNTIANWIEP
ncbi:MAG TPA: hypothetical protein VHE82_06645 [Gemmatimonadaceae bacterium]|nr:hypothetical protein [Gemmatimonadaceae bacterium]